MNKSSGILVVDDEDGVCETLGNLLQGQGYRVWRAQSGAEALQIYQQQPEDIRLVILDVTLPGLDGRETFLALRNINRQARCCFMKSDPSPYDEEELMRIGAVKVFSKPFLDWEEVSQLLELCNRNNH